MIHNPADISRNPRKDDKMLLELILTPIFALLQFLIGLIPEIPQNATHEAGFERYISYFLDIFSIGFVFFPFALFMFAISNVLFWLSLQMAWAVIEWIYKKIPGVN